MLGAIFLGLVFGCDVSSVFRSLRLNSTRSSELFYQNCTCKRATLSNSEALFSLFNGALLSCYISKILPLLTNLTNYVFALHVFSIRKEALRIHNSKISKKACPVTSSNFERDNVCGTMRHVVCQERRLKILI
jgi:hypothetical protein